MCQRDTPPKEVSVCRGCSRCESIREVEITESILCTSRVHEWSGVFVSICASYRVDENVGRLNILGLHSSIHKHRLPLQYTTQQPHTNSFSEITMIIWHKSMHDRLTPKSLQNTSPLKQATSGERIIHSLSVEAILKNTNMTFFRWERTSVRWCSGRKFEWDIEVIKRILCIWLFIAN